MRKLALFIAITLTFACKRSIHPLQRSFDAKLVDTLQKLEQRYGDKKVRINTWNQQTNTYEDIELKDPQDKTLETLTIGDSVVFISLDFNNPQEIKAQVKKANKTGFIPYWTVEEFEGAKKVDPDLRN